MSRCRSHVVELIIKKAFDDGKKFRVVVVDSRPKFEGIHLSSLPPLLPSHLSSLFLHPFILFLYYLFVLSGKALLTSLTKHGVPCTYTMLNGISYIMKEVLSSFSTIISFLFCFFVCFVNLLFI